MKLTNVIVAISMLVALAGCSSLSGKNKIEVVYMFEHDDFVVVSSGQTVGGAVTQTNGVYFTVDGLSKLGEAGLLPSD